MHEHRGQVLWDRVALALLIVIVLMVTGWYLETRFGSMVTVMTFGGLLAVALVLVGFRLASGHTKHTLDIAADFLHEVKQGDKQQWGVIREYARADGHALRRQTDLEFMQAKRVDQLAQQRARLLTDAEKRDADRYAWEDDVEPSRQQGGFEIFE